MRKLFFWLLISAVLFFYGSFLTGCIRVEKETPRILLEENVVLPTVTSLALFGTGFPGEECFAFSANDGYIRIVDVFTGRQLAVYPAGEEKIISLSFNNERGELVSCSETGNVVTFPVFSPGATAGQGTESLISQVSFTQPQLDSSGSTGGKKIFILDDGAICLADSATEKEIARYYYFGSLNKPPVDGSAPDDTAEWTYIVPEGFYTTSIGSVASFQSTTYLTVELGKQRYRLDQLSGALFRPDLFKA